MEVGSLPGTKEKGHGQMVSCAGDVAKMLSGLVGLSPTRAQLPCQEKSYYRATCLKPRLKASRLLPDVSTPLQALRGMMTSKTGNQNWGLHHALASAWRSSGPQHLGTWDPGLHQPRRKGRMVQGRTVGLQK